MQTILLNNGVEMPILGFGTYQVENAAACEKAVADAIAVGYRLIDTAACYFNEEAVGKAIRQSGLPREDFFVTTKLWVQDMGYDATRKAFEASLQRLGLEYLDLYLIHQAYGDVYGSWRAMEDLYREGKVRAIGVSNFFPDRMMDLILHHEIVPAVNQIETHPFYQREKDHQFLQEQGVIHESWGPFAEGKHHIFQNAILQKIAQNHGKSVAQVILRWLIQRNIVVIPKSVHPERMVENFQVFDMELSPEEMTAIASLDQNVSSFFDHRDPAIIRWINDMKIHD